ncbi:three-helix bundle dimerization domain-containing protein [Streptacidiphilus sp. EB103A]|uniref:three-helix bundle dimerization domain-containing protein n=1 Tax=Streptacidiphilus sp. EB103A TaxID=3156275 RepID=UPI003517BF6A
MSLDLREDEAVRKVSERLKATYRHQYQPDRVEATVTAAREHFLSSPIRDFIPVLVERRARAALDNHPRGTVAMI